jgi:hypothetical protein
MEVNFSQNFQGTKAKNGNFFNAKTFDTNRPAFSLFWQNKITVSIRILINIGGS